MTAHTYEEIASDKALVCRTEKVTDAGAGTIWYVLLADGYLLDCGSGPGGQKRAEELAETINGRASYA